jgi:hypothetical protein
MMDASVVVHVLALAQLALSQKVTEYSLSTLLHVLNVELVQVLVLQVQSS